MSRNRWILLCILNIEVSIYVQQVGDVDDLIQHELNSWVVVIQIDIYKKVTLSPVKERQ